MILIIANARRKGGLSGSDNIYEAFEKHWQICKVQTIWTESYPFWLNYIWRIWHGCICAIFDKQKYEFVYSASDFLMDSLPAFIYKLKGNKWIAGYYMVAPKGKILYRISQWIAEFLIYDHADVVCVTNESLFYRFPRKKCIAVHGGVDLSKAKQLDNKEYDAVFVGRLHYTKGIKELTQIWDKVMKHRPDAHLAIIGDGDTEKELLKNWVADHMSNVSWFHYLGDARFDIYAHSKMVLYTTPPEHSHFSMGPVEAMACGCPMIVFKQDVMRYIRPKGTCHRPTVKEYAVTVIALIDLHGVKHPAYKKESKEAIEWAQTWDWSKRAPNILRQIREYLK